MIVIIESTFTLQSCTGFPTTCIATIIGYKIEYLIGSNGVWW